ncbi:hypothetical protein BDZ94DRAFT_1272901 [Collybia nuda]|uniref:Zinc finger PHD-type domain-containing protein n=1 Tax=Collybia nuda TaxID=64659 RepID=A0A9P5XXM5_9AGAR|nr:hypothetical protein BDZ94DRAFT_1272901 [Collybia nuda]
MGPLAKTPCVKCLDNSSTPSAFLLTCRNCSTTWHHRCHTPPVSDSELVARIRAYNSGDFENGIAGWTCRRCMKGKDKAVLPSQSSAVLSISEDSFSEQPSKTLQGQTHAKSMRAKSTRSKTLQATKPHDPQATYNGGLQTSGSRGSRNQAEPVHANRTKPSVTEVVDLTISSDEETAQPPNKEAERSHHTRFQSKPLGHTTLSTQFVSPVHNPSRARSPPPPSLQLGSSGPQKTSPLPLTLNPPIVQTPPSPSIQYESPTSQNPSTPPIQHQIYTSQLGPLIPTLQINPATQILEIPPASPITPDPPTSPAQQPPVQTKPELVNNIRPKSEPDLEPVPTITPWQAYNLAPSWIQRNKGAENPWEDFHAKRMASARVYISRRKLVARRLDARVKPDHETLFSFSSTTWLRARDEKDS